MTTWNIRHVFNKSISQYHVFRDAEDFKRIRALVRFYQYGPLPGSFAHFWTSIDVRTHGFDKAFYDLIRQRSLSRKIHVIAYCFMSNHYHLLIDETDPGALRRYVSNVFNAYGKYLNLRRKRRGPLWQGHYRSFAVDPEQIKEKTVYIHLNPVTAYMVEQPDQWEHSSYGEYVKDIQEDRRICSPTSYVDITGYRAWVCGQIEHYRQQKAVSTSKVETAKRTS